MIPLLRLRLRHQHLTGAPLASPADVVTHFAAIQSQDYPAALWGVARRTDGATLADVERAHDAGEILRTHVLRPTWHFVRAADLRWMQALTAPNVNRHIAGRHRELGLDARTLDRAAAALTRGLAGKSLTRPELAAVLTRARINADGPRITHMVMHAELAALICSGPRRGKHATYALFDERCPPAAALDRDDALGRLAARYFVSHGPARVVDFAWWSGLSLRDARRAIDIAKLPAHTIEGEPYVGAVAAPPRAAKTLHLLPDFDEYVVAYRHRAHTLHDGVATSIEMLAKHAVVRDGRVIGSWSRTRSKAGVAIGLQLVEPLAPAHQRLLAGEVKRYGAFLGLPTRLA